MRSKAEEYGICELKLQHQIAHPYMIKPSRHPGRPEVCDLISFVALLPDEDTCYRFLRPYTYLVMLMPNQMDLILSHYICLVMLIPIQMAIILFIFVFI